MSKAKYKAQDKNRYGDEILSIDQNHATLRCHYCGMIFNTTFKGMHADGCYACRIEHSREKNAKRYVERKKNGAKAREKKPREKEMSPQEIEEFLKPQNMWKRIYERRYETRQCLDELASKST